MFAAKPVPIFLVAVGRVLHRNDVIQLVSLLDDAFALALGGKADGP